MGRKALKAELPQMRHTAIAISREKVGNRRQLTLTALTTLIILVTLLSAALPLKAAEKAEPKKAKPAKIVKDPSIAAKRLFGFVLGPAEMKAKSIGYYTRGCLAGGKALAVDGPAWQAMRLSRNRNWGHPKLISYLEKFAKAVREKDGWPGILVGDLSQPRGGPMLTGHRSHQIGIDADVWLNPMPDRRLSYKEREETSAISMLDKTGLKVNPRVWTKQHVKVIRRAASYPEVARVLVHPAIKKALCDASGDDKGWLYKIRPWYGHHYHMHIRLNCQNGGCKNQPAPARHHGCDKQLDYWFALLKRTPKPPCHYGTLQKKDKGWSCSCAKPLKFVAIGKKGGGKCVNEDGTLPKPKVVKKNLAWMPKACHAVLGEGAPPLWNALNLDEDIGLPIRKAVAKGNKEPDPITELIKGTEPKKDDAKDQIGKLIEEKVKVEPPEKKAPPKPEKK